jgi:hypothetical protein
MIKSNTKIFKEKVKKYVVECMEDGENDMRECLQIALEDFNSWYCEYNKKQYPNIINALVQYFNCGSTDIEIYYDNQRELLKEWYEETDKEAMKYDDIQVCDNFYYQVAKAFISLCKDYNINI